MYTSISGQNNRAVNNYFSAALQLVVLKNKHETIAYVICCKEGSVQLATCLIYIENPFKWSRPRGDKQF